MRDEIHQQPEVLQGLLQNQWEHVKQIASNLRGLDIKYIFLVARGSSDNAGLYAKYLLGLHNKLPVALAAPSMFSVYRKPPDLCDCVVLGISQSGESPDIVKVLRDAQRNGVPTISITNMPDSPLSQVADMVIDIGADVETAIAATKSYTGQLMAIAMLSAALSEEGERYKELEGIPECLTRTLRIESDIDDAATLFAEMVHGVVLGRGYNYATANEWSLKMKELAYVVAAPYSSADFLHGPVALIEQDFPVFAIIQSGDMFDELSSLVERLKSKFGARTLVITNNPMLSIASDVILVVPEELPEHLSPIISIVPAQLLSYYLACKKGIDPDSPRGLKKVTQTI
ncbi:MAG: SIS domain-containing protein [Anaerolineales bacterium]|nr:SIS domain-containing protein [Anaerolineales bacterium]